MTEQDSEHQIRAADCLRSATLFTPWERRFLRGMVDLPRLTPRQRGTLATLCARLARKAVAR